MIEKLKLFLERNRNVQVKKVWSCWELVVSIYSSCFGIEIPMIDESEYLDEKKVENFFELMRNTFIKVDLAKTGDIIVFRGEPYHTGVVLNKGLMCHVNDAGDICVDNFMRNYWKFRMEGIYRFSGFV